MRHVYVLAMLLALSGCNCGGIGVKEYPAEAAKTLCTRMYQCCTAAEVQNNKNFGPDQAACEARVRASLDDSTLIEEGERKSRLRFHSDRAAECLRQYQALSCEQLKSNATTITPACEAYLEPKVAIGGACGSDDECVGSSCEGEGIGVDGVCQAFIGESGACNDGGSCEEGLYCDGSGCKRLKADGTACGGNFECATGGCNGKNPDAGTPGTCGLKGGEGTTCYATSGCSASGGMVAGWLVLLGVAGALLSRRRRAA